MATSNNTANNAAATPNTQETMNTITFVFPLCSFDADLTAAHSYGEHKAYFTQYLGADGDMKSMARLHFMSGFISGLPLSTIMDDGTVRHSFEREEGFEKALHTYNINIDRDILDGMYEAFTQEGSLSKSQLAMIANPDFSNGKVKPVAQLHVQVAADFEVEVSVKNGFQTLHIAEDDVLSFIIVKRGDDGFVRTGKTSKGVDVLNTLYKGTTPGHTLSAEETRANLLKGVSTSSRCRGAAKPGQGLKVKSAEALQAAAEVVKQAETAANVTNNLAPAPSASAKPMSPQERLMAARKSAM